jgi:hypothetical protein
MHHFRPHRTPAWRRPVAALLGLLLAAGCAHRNVPLDAGDRAQLAREPVVHVLHYPSPAPVVKAAGKAAVPTPVAVERSAGGDPAGQMAQGLARLIGKKQRLRNLKVEKQPLPRPVVEDVSRHKARFRHGLALETWVDDWSLEPARNGSGDYLVTLQGRARLARIDDGRVLWLSKTCRVGNDSHNTRVTARDLTNATRVRRAALAARDECVRQLARDFFATERK